MDNIHLINKLTINLLLRFGALYSGAIITRANETVWVSSSWNWSIAESGTWAHKKDQSTEPLGQWDYVDGNCGFIWRDWTIGRSSSKMEYTMSYWKSIMSYSRLYTTIAVTTPTAPALASRTSSASNQVKLPKLMIQPYHLLENWQSGHRSENHFPLQFITTQPSLQLRKIQLSTLAPQVYCFRAVAGLSLSAANYQEAISILEKHFGSKQCIIAKHMDALMCLAVVTSPNDLKSLQGLYDGVELHTPCLKSLGVNLDSHGKLLTSFLMNKLPHWLQLLVNH